MPKVSFVATVYNKAPFLPHVAAALAAQEGAFDREFCQVAYSEQQHSYDLRVSPQQVLAGLTERRGEVGRRDDMLRRSLRRAQTTPTAWLARADLVRRIGGCDARVFIQDYSIELRLAKKSGFAHVDTRIYLSPTRIEGRLSGNEAQTLHDMNLALAYFLSDHTDIPLELRRHALTRAAGQASAWARRRARKGPLSSEFIRYLGARTAMMPPSFENCRATCRIFSEINEIRLMADTVGAPPYLTADAV